MNIHAFAAITNIAAFSALVYFVTHDYPWWGAACLLFIAYPRSKDES